MSRTLTPSEARAFYDRFGSKQDLQRFYEDPAIEVLLSRAAFEEAVSVVEVGCGTGRLAERLLRERLPAGATYDGFDISSTMVNLAEGRLAPWDDRAHVHLTDGSPSLPLADRSCDRFLCAYILDLLSEDDIRSVLGEARRVLVPGGRLCVVTLTHGQSLVSRIVSLAWRWAHRLNPRLVGGCRPLRLMEFAGAGWRVLHREVVCTIGICTEVLVAS
ncbi:MAG: class I SAM-dependent methyltransferase [Acidithiobacillales bacterium]